MTKPLIALLTDFGERDGFAGVMKGVIYSVKQTPDVPIVDISHGVAPQNVHDASWVLENSFRHFPEGTVFVCVVDPKVGDDAQKPILAHWESRNQFFIAPDNGLISPIADMADFPFRVYVIENRDLFYDPKNVSQTFHGRDIYAPVAARLADALAEGTLDVFLESVGHQTGDFVRFEPSQATRQYLEEGALLEGVIEHVDGFGNLITNIPNAWISLGKIVDIQVLQHQWQSQKLASYAHGEGQNQVFLVPGSGGTIELCLYGKSAREVLEAEVEDMVAIQFEKA